MKLLGSEITLRSLAVSTSPGIGKFEPKRVIQWINRSDITMSAEQNKEMVTATWTAFGKGDIKTAFANMADNVSWLIPGSTPGVSGVKRGKDEILKFMASVGNLFPEGLKSEITRAHATEDAVILELTNRGKVSNGKSYENEYCFVFELENGKIRRIREYVDTQKAKDILFS
jgi:ketosteroid isomerase-like protein